MQNFVSTLDWFGHDSPYAPQVRYQCPETHFVMEFRIRKNVDFDESLENGQFVEGLWERDVAELFVSGPGEDYQEINISPSGAWWSAHFTSYRERSKELEFDVKIDSRVGPEFWNVRFETALTNLLPWNSCELHQRRISPTVILFDPDPHYFAWNHSAGGEPDFHRADLLQPLRSS